MEPLTLVMLPGLDGTGLMFKSFLAALPASLIPQVVPFPGDQPLNYEELLALVMQALPRDRPFVLLGESFSGPLALRAAQQRPPGLRAVILSASFIRNPIRHLPARARVLAQPLLIRLTPFTLLRRLLGRGAPAGLLLRAREAMAQVLPAVFAARLRAVLTLDAGAALEACPVPILYLQARQDALIRPHNLRAMQRLRPDLEVAIIEGPHWLLQSHPEQAVHQIVDFLERQLILQ